MLNLKKITAAFLSAAFLSFSLTSCNKTGLKDGQMAVYFFQAGKADAMLLYTDESSVLIDTGKNTFGEKIVRYLNEKGISELDALILTHFDEDHIGGAPALLDKISVKNIYVSNFPKDSKECAALETSLDEKGLKTITVTGSETVSMDLDGMKITIDGPDEEVYEENDSNNSSLITELEFNGHDFLFMGDAQKLRSDEYISQHPDIHPEVLKVPHHGYYHKFLKDLAADLAPQYAVITCSNKDGGEEKTLKAFEKAGSTILKTNDYAITMVVDDEITVKTEDSSNK